jgi:hypothetical protein
MFCSLAPVIAAHERRSREIVVLDDENGLELSAQEIPPANCRSVQRRA